MAQITTEYVKDIFNINHKLAPYGTYQIHVEYNVSFGKLQLPVAPTVANISGIPPINIGTQPAEIAVTRLPYGKKTVVWVAERLGKMPLVPNPFVTDTNLVLAEIIFKPLSAVPTLDGQSRIYRFAGVYVYFELRPIGPQSTFGNMFVPGTDIDTVGPEVIPPGVYSNLVS